MSNMEDWVRQQADTHKKEKQEQAEAEKKANEEVQALQQAVVKGAQPYWDDLMEEFCRAGEELKKQFPDQQISVGRGSRDATIDKGKILAVHLGMTRVSDIRIHFLATVGDSGDIGTIEDSDYKISNGKNGLCLKADGNESMPEVTAEDRIKSMVSIVFDQI